jgi:hypothetical protein
MRPRITGLVVLAPCTPSAVARRPDDCLANSR